MSFAVFELLKELGLGLVVQIRILGVLHVLVPHRRVHDLRLRLNGLAHALADAQGLAFISRLGLQALLRQGLSDLNFQRGGLRTPVDLGTLCMVQRFLDGTLERLGVLYSDNLVDPVAKTGHLLATLVQSIL